MSDIHVCVCACWYVCVWTMWEACKGFALFEKESLRYPGFVEFDDVNGKVLTYSVAGVCMSWCIRGSTDVSCLNECISSIVSLLFLSWPCVLCTHAHESRPCNSPDKVYKVWDLKNYTHLYSIADNNIYEIKISPVILLHLYTCNICTCIICTSIIQICNICIHILQSTSLCFIANEYVLALSFAEPTNVFYLSFVVAMR